METSTGRECKINYKDWMEYERWPDAVAACLLLEIDPKTQIISDAYGNPFIINENALVLFNKIKTWKYSTNGDTSHPLWYINKAVEKGRDIPDALLKEVEKNLLNCPPSKRDSFLKYESLSIKLNLTPPKDKERDEAQAQTQTSMANLEALEGDAAPTKTIPKYREDAISEAVINHILPEVLPDKTQSLKKGDGWKCFLKLESVLKSMKATSVRFDRCSPRSGAKITGSDKDGVSIDTNFKAFSKRLPAC